MTAHPPAAAEPLQPNDLTDSKALNRARSRLGTADRTHCFVTSGLHNPQGHASLVWNVMVKGADETRVVSLSLPMRIGLCCADSSCMCTSCRHHSNNSCAPLSMSTERSRGREALAKLERSRCAVTSACPAARLSVGMYAMPTSRATSAARCSIKLMVC